VATLLAKRALRVRMLGSSAVDQAWAAAGRLGAAVSFGNHPWDNAPGALLIRSAGGVVSDLEGGPYGLASTSMVAGSPGVVEDLAAVFAELGDPAGFA
ncbi:MAG TPA: inositol monophosphatase family protein, partial [Cryptosporangiaceae bacterium]|nr:inositol monophosphatase family protein [Cryptosporangiaceae bacterium]